MQEIKDKESKDASTEYAMKIFHEDFTISGFLHVKILRIRNLMRAWKSASEKRAKGNTEDQDVDI
jgi:hypothetical protein